MNLLRNRRASSALQFAIVVLAVVVALLVIVADIGDAIYELFLNITHKLNA